MRGRADFRPGLFPREAPFTNNGKLAEPEEKYAALMEAAIAAGRTAAGI